MVLLLLTLFNSCRVVETNIYIYQQGGTIYIDQDQHQQADKPVDFDTTLKAH